LNNVYGLDVDCIMIITCMELRFRSIVNNDPKSLRCR